MNKEEVVNFLYEAYKDKVITKLIYKKLVSRARLTTYLPQDETPKVITNEFLKEFCSEIETCRFANHYCHNKNKILDCFSSKTVKHGPSKGH